MMKLTLMKQFFDTVDKNWQSPIADQLVQRWLDAPAEAYCIRASANFAFRVNSAEAGYVLRFNHASERQPETIAGELAFIESLVERGIHAARPLRSLNGNLIESDLTSLGLCHAVLFEAMPGEELEKDNLDATGYERWGRTLAEMHRASLGLKINNRPDWQDHITLARQIIPKSEGYTMKELDTLQERLSRLPIYPDNYGLIHFDFETDNLLWDGTILGIIDFDDCAWYWFTADIANGLRSIFDDRAEKFDLQNPQLQSFLKGYRSVRNIDDEEIRLIPLFLRLNNLVIFARISWSIAEGLIDNEPTWTSNLRKKLTGYLHQYRDSFENHPTEKIGD